MIPISAALAPHSKVNLGCLNRYLTRLALSFGEINLLTPQGLMYSSCFPTS